uniref:AP complex subunit sigma n=1 Tax=Alexandrium catenella TaxID=2925 RepID=A0A7S1RK99_ALECA
MIKCVLIVNNQGKSRLVRFYYDVPMDRQKHILHSVYRIVSTRVDDNCCQFAQDEDLFGEDHKIIYRHYATLYFIFVADSAESELGILDLIQVFVQVLDSCFENVCELDLIYHFDRVNYILDEIVMSGMVLETHADLVLQAIKEAKKLEQEGSTFGF